MSELTAEIAEAFDEAREELLGPEAKLLLLKAQGAPQPYLVLEALTLGWSVYFSEFHGTTTFQVARDDIEFNAVATQATHVMVIDSNSASLNNQLHTINGETTFPAGVDPYWRIRAEVVGRRYFPE